MNNNERRIPLYERELGSITSFLGTLLCEQVFCTMEDDGNIACVHTTTTTIARLSVFRKGPTRDMQYVVISLNNSHEAQKIAFQLGFLGCKVSFKKPAAELYDKWVQRPRE